MVGVGTGVGVAISVSASALFTSPFSASSTTEESGEAFGSGTFSGLPEPVICPRGVSEAPPAARAIRYTLPSNAAMKAERTR